MSHLYRKDLQYADSANLDAFGRLRTSAITSLLEVQHHYDKNPLLVSETVSGGTSVFDSTNSCVSMGTSATGQYVIRKTKSVGIYQPGKGQQFEASFSDFQLETNVVKRVGYFSSNKVAPFDSDFDGFFLESDGITTNEISFNIYKAGTQIYRSPVSSWSTTEFDATTIDWSKTNLMLTDFQWLGVGRVRFCMVIGGVIRTFTTYTASNTISTVYMRSPSQPIRYEIRQTGSGSGTFKQICSQVSMEGAINRLNKQVGINTFAETTLATAGTKYPILGYRIGATYNGVVALMENASIIATSAATDHALVTIELNPTLSATPTWNTITNCPIESASGNGSQTVTTPGYILSNWVVQGQNIAQSNILLEEIAIKPGFAVDGTQDMVWLCITPSANTSKFRTTANIQYWM